MMTLEVDISHYSICPSSGQGFNFGSSHFDPSSVGAHSPFENQPLFNNEADPRPLYKYGMKLSKLILGSSRCMKLTNVHTQAYVS